MIEDKIIEDARESARPSTLLIDWPTVNAAWQKTFKQTTIAFREMGEAAQKALKMLNGYVSDWHRVFREVANDEARVCGLEARYYVVGGLACKNSEDLHALIRDLMSDPAAVSPPEDRIWVPLLTRESRARLAASAIRGYISHQEKNR